MNIEKTLKRIDELTDEWCDAQAEKAVALRDRVEVYANSIEVEEDREKPPVEVALSFLGLKHPDEYDHTTRKLIAERRLKSIELKCRVIDADFRRRASEAEDARADHLRAYEERVHDFHAEFIEALRLIGGEEG